MTYTNLLEKSIYVLPVGDYYGKEADSLSLVYAPLTDHLLLADKLYIDKLNNAVNTDTPGEEVAEELEKLRNTGKYGKKMYTVCNPSEYLLLYILPNHTCNFSCSYCFSAKGRSQKQLSKEHLKVALNYFVDSARVNEKKLFITFLGGGEPLLSWELVAFGIEYASSLATSQGIQLMLEIVTNGSLLNDRILDILIRYNVGIRVSFEILEDIQNSQRGHYAKVAANIHKLIAAGLYIEIRAMITPLNVNRLEEMVQELINRFDGINYYMFDPVTDPGMFSDPAQTARFYRQYRQHFLSALDLAERHNKQLKCAPLRNLQSIVQRYCFGELCLTPEGTITICHRISSSADADYENMVYGYIDESNRLRFNQEKYQTLISSHTVHSGPNNCKDCFLQWNCAGGCMVQNNTYNNGILSVICDFNRDFSKELLLRRIRK
ncbi:MAG: radical SAM protein [Tannerellaceae bacterium]|nr:radical SAM protein [Tannerellaceae bacterium]